MKYWAYRYILECQNTSRATNSCVALLETVLRYERRVCILGSVGE